MPTLLFGVEPFTLNSKQKQQIQTAEMRFLRTVKGCTILDEIRIDDIRDELQVCAINDKIVIYRMQWVQHIENSSPTKLPKIIYNYKPT